MVARRPVCSCLLAVFAALVLAATPARAVLVSSTCQACTGSGAGECETGPTQIGRGATADIARFWSADGFAFAASSAITTDYVSVGGFARGSGVHNPPDSDPFLNNVSRTGRAFGSFRDRLSAGSGGGSGFLRIPIHLAGSTLIEWQNGGGTASFGLSCQSFLPGAPTTLGPCATVSRSFTNTGVFDEVLNIDLPILLGTTFEFAITFSASATSGYGYENVPPFSGQAQIDFGTEPFLGAIVLDANKQPIPGAPISLGESGFDYQAAPEPASLIGVVTAIACLVRLRRLPSGLRRVGRGR